MALLGRKTKDPIDMLERELGDLVGRREMLAQRLATAKTALEAATDVRRTSLLDADLSDEEACLRRDQLCRAARDQVESLSDAVSEINGRVAAAEAKLAEQRDRVEREEVARSVTADADALVAARDAFVLTAQQLLAAMQPVVAKVPINAEFAPQLAGIIGTISPAIDELLGDARRHAAGVMNGNVPGVRPAPQPPEPERAVPVERERIYTLANIAWCEGSQVMTAPKYSWASPPKHIAERACRRNLADRPEAERIERLLAGFGAIHGPVPADMCINLDTIDQPAAEPAERTLPPGFQERVGPARVMEIAVNRT
jgi:hypothetical protein